MTINSSHPTTPYPGSISDCLLRINGAPWPDSSGDEYDPTLEEQSDESSYFSENEADSSSYEGLMPAQKRYNERKIRWCNDLTKGLMKHVVLEKAAMAAKFVFIGCIAHLWKHCEEDYHLLALSTFFLIACDHIEKKAREKICRVYDNNIKPQNFYNERPDSITGEIEAEEVD